MSSFVYLLTRIYILYSIMELIPTTPEDTIKAVTEHEDYLGEIDNSSAIFSQTFLLSGLIITTGIVVCVVFYYIV